MSSLKTAATEHSGADLIAALGPRGRRCEKPGCEAESRALELVETNRGKLLADFSPPSFPLPERDDTRLTSVMSMLSADQTLVVYDFDGEKSQAYVVEGTGVTQVELPTTTSVIGTLVSRFHDRLSAPPARPDDVTWRPLASAIYNQLLLPLEPWLPAGRELIFVAGGPLANLPISALVRDVGGDAELVCDRYRVRHVPDPLSFAYFQPHGRPPLTMAIYANPVNRVLPRAGLELPPLPAADIEGWAVSRMFPSARFVRGAEATRKAILKDLETHAVVHVASHAKSISGAPALSFVMLSDDDDSGLLWAGELAGMHLSTELVVLSACETAASGKATNGSGIHTALLAAGVRSVLASLWAVNDEATSEFMVDFYGGYVTEPAVNALKAAQRRLAARKSYQHPHYWAPFVLYDQQVH